MSDQISSAEVVEKLMGGNRTIDQIEKDGARLAVRQINELRRQLDQAESDCQHVIATGKAREDTAQIWKRVGAAADRLLDGML